MQYLTLNAFSVSFYFNTLFHKLNLAVVLKTSLLRELERERGREVGRERAWERERYGTKTGIFNETINVA